MTKKRIGLCRVIVHFRAEVEKRARKVPINDSVEQLLSYLFRKNHGITLKYDQETVRGVAKLKFCDFKKVVKYLHICWCILSVGKRDFRIYVIFTQSVTF